MRAISFIIALAIASRCEAAKSELKFAWNEVDFTWNSPADRDKALNDKTFIPKNNLPLGLARWKNKLFVTVPKWKSGVASTLNYVEVDGAQDQLLKPYPSFEANFMPDSAKELPSNNSLVSVFRVDVDDCDRLWVMDTGTADRLGISNKVVGPSIAIFDLKTDQLIHRHFMKADVLTPRCLFGNIVVDVNKDKCDDAFAYVADVTGNTVVVYSLKQDDAWGVNHHYFHFDPTAGFFNVSGETDVQNYWKDGVIGMALSEPTKDGYRTMYFHPLASTKEFYVSTELLQNYKQIKKNVYHDFKILGDRGTYGQSAASFYDPKTHVIFYTQVNRDGVSCWNTNKPYTPENNPLIIHDPVEYQFPSDLKVDNEGLVWIMSDRIPRFMVLGPQADVINYRIFKVMATDAIAGTTCESSE